MNGYSQRCIARLESIGAPRDGWFCEEVITMPDADFICELCDYDRIKYVHVMVHPQWPDKFHVGCVCDGTMSSDLLAAKERDDEAKRREARRRSFMKKQWEEHPAGYMVLPKTRNNITAEKDSFYGKEFYKVSIDGEPYQWWENHRIETLEDAKAVAFEVLDYERKTDRADTGS